MTSGNGRPLDLRHRPVSWALVMLARLYQASISAWLGGHCKFRPTCSQYFIDAVTQKGALRGTAMGFWRICRCNPFGHGGYDPVR